MGHHKCDSAAQSIAGLNSRVQVELHRDGLTPENAVGIVTRYDVVVDASDNAPTRYLIRCTGACLASGCVGVLGCPWWVSLSIVAPLACATHNSNLYAPHINVPTSIHPMPWPLLCSDACCVARKPLVSGAAIGLEGQLTVYCAGDDSPCYRCLFPEAPLPQSCSRCSDAGVLGVVPGIIGTLQVGS